MPVIKEVAGRLEDVVISPDGRRMVRFHLVFDQPHIREGQVIQAIDRSVSRSCPQAATGPPTRNRLSTRLTGCSGRL